MFVAPTAATLAIAHANLAKNKETELTISASPSLYVGGIAETVCDHRRLLHQRAQQKIETLCLPD